MSIHEATVETQSIYHVVGRRTTGEQVVISESADLAAAETIVALMWGTEHYGDIFIECDGEQFRDADPA
jgi:hypothetical protein